MLEYVRKDKKKKKVTFKKLIDKYPDESLDHINPKKKNDEFKNHCAINLSQALFDNEIEIKNFKGAKCWFKCPAGKIFIQ